MERFRKGTAFETPTRISGTILRCTSVTLPGLNSTSEWRFILDNGPLKSYELKNWSNKGGVTFLQPGDQVEFDWYEGLRKVDGFVNHTFKAIWDNRKDPGPDVKARARMSQVIHLRLTPLQREELLHKLEILRDEAELLEAYRVTCANVAAGVRIGKMEDPT